MARSPESKFVKGTQPRTAPRRTRLSDPGNVPTVLASELASIEVQGPITILTFSEILRKDGPDEIKRVCARVAIPSSMLKNIAWRIDNLTVQAKALETAVVGSA